MKSIGRFKEQNDGSSICLFQATTTDVLCQNEGKGKLVENWRCLPDERTKNTANTTNSAKNDISAADDGSG